jgi:hypothetical protein
MGQILSEVFYTFLITSLIGLIVAVGKMFYKSKCSEINLCCITVKRNIEAEVREDIELGNQRYSNEDKDSESKKETI